MQVVRATSPAPAAAAPAKSATVAAGNAPSPSRPNAIAQALRPERPDRNASLGDLEMTSHIIIDSRVRTKVGPFGANVQRTAAASHSGEPQMKRSTTHRVRTITALAGLLPATFLTAPQLAAKDEGTRAIARSPLAVSIEGPPFGSPDP